MFIISAFSYSSAQVISEIEIDPPSAISDACQYVEVRGVPGAVIPVNTYFLSVNSDGGNFGFANQAVNMGGLVVGSNGTITLFNTSFGECPNRTYGTGTTRFNYFSPLRIGTGSETYLIARSTGTLFSGQDLDANNDGNFDAGLGIAVLDGFALIVNPDEEFVYGASAGVVNISNTTSLDQPDAVTRFAADPTPFSAAAFFFGELAASPDETVTYAAPFSPNFPTGAVLTPGDGNMPTPNNTVQFSANSYPQDESQVATVTVTRSGTLSGTMTVTARTANGSATGGAACGMGVDFVNQSQLLTFGPNVSSQTFQVSLCSDTLPEGLETVNLLLVNPTGGGVGATQTATININDTASQFRNSASIAMTNASVANPYPSQIVVSGSNNNINSMRVTLYDVYHSSPDNIDVLLVGPGGQKFVLMADSGGTVAINQSNAATLTFSDTAGAVVPNSTSFITGLYEPTNWEPVGAFAAPAPGLPYNEPGSAVGGTGAQTFAGTFGGIIPNGTWSLYVRDDGNVARPNAPTAITGEIAGGWGIEFFAPTAAGVSVAGRVQTADGLGLRNAEVRITDADGRSRSIRTGSFGYFRFDDVEAGQSYVLSVRSQRFRFTSRVIQVADSIVDLTVTAEQ